MHMSMNLYDAGMWTPHNDQKYKHRYSLTLQAQVLAQIHVQAQVQDQHWRDMTTAWANIQTAPNVNSLGPWAGAFSEPSRCRPGALSHLRLTFPPPLA